MVVEFNALGCGWGPDQGTTVASPPAGLMDIIPQLAQPGMF